MVAINVIGTGLSIDLAIESDGGESWRSAGISMSSVGHKCIRKLWYDLHWVGSLEEISGRTRRYFEIGNIDEERILKWLKMAGFEVEDEEFLGKQKKVILAGGFLRGKLDGRVRGIPEAPKAIHVTEMKSINQKIYDFLIKKGVKEVKFDHYTQIQMYMHSTGDKRGLYIALNRNEQTLYIERIKYDIDFCLRAEGRALNVAESDTPPPKLHESMSKPMAKRDCAICSHQGICHRGQFPSESNCRTCVFVQKILDGNSTWHCTRFNTPRSYSEQMEGCDAHIYIPELVPGEVIDFDEESHIATYKLADGRIWKDGGGQGVSGGNS